METLKDEELFVVDTVRGADVLLAGCARAREQPAHAQAAKPCSADALPGRTAAHSLQAADDAAVPAAVRKRARREPKPLRSQLILDGLRDGITPVHQPGVRKAKGPGRPLPNSTAAAADAQQAQQQPARKKQRRRRPGAQQWTAHV